ncbi:MAG: hypothetical protein KJZ86_17835 [Caldilineaceae bacterium]|nr:hypothetical protein [Caldilineaceae bacterium]HRJ41343.1 hypothetical protein [Caldilineaceae bacterium]
MAYTFIDHYRPIRIMLRIDALVVGLGLGILLLFHPLDMLAHLGLAADPPLMSRLAGSALLGLGIGLLLAAGEIDLRAGTLVAAIVSNGLLAATLFLTYLSGELSGLTTWGYLALILLFVVCLLTAVLPIPYLRQGIGF